MAAGAGGFVKYNLRLSFKSWRRVITMYLRTPNKIRLVMALINFSSSPKKLMISLINSASERSDLVWVFEFKEGRNEGKKEGIEV
jgi:GTP-binding protein EngB required for normal cell division